MPQPAEGYSTAIEILKDNHDKPVMQTMMLFAQLLSNANKSRKPENHLQTF
jgi:hypothetical protein